MNMTDEELERSTTAPSIDWRDSEPPPHGLISILANQVQMYGPVDVLRATFFVLDIKLRHPTSDVTDELVAALRQVMATIDPALHQAWLDWPYKGGKNE